MRKKKPYEELLLQNLKGELWKDIPGLEMYGQVSNFGRIKRLSYELEYSDGRIFIKPEMIIKPVVMKIPNAFMKDHVFFLRATMTLFRQQYNFSVARLVYHCFVERINLADDTIVILTKDRNGLNIRPSNLVKATLTQRQRRSFDLNRHQMPVPDEERIKRWVQKTRERLNKEISQYSMNGKRIKTFASIALASEETGISHSHISNRARGVEYSAGRFIWRFGKAPVVDITPMLEAIERRRKKNKQTFGKEVTQYTIGGKRIATFPTLRDAYLATGTRPSEISLVARGKRASAGGFFWKAGHGRARIDLSGHEHGATLKGKRRMRPVVQYSMDGKRLHKYEGIKLAARAVGVSSTSIIGALRGSQTTSGGFKWKYL